MLRLKRALWLFALFATFICVVMVMLFGWHQYVDKKYAHLIHEVKNCPKKDVAMILGTAKYVRGGYENLFYRYRMDTAKALHQTGKVDYWLVSGDNGHKNYNEPKSMKNDLLKLGIKENHIQPDYAGFRTLDSIYRMEKVFGNHEYMIISQPFHLARAIFIAKHKGHNVVGCVARMPSQRYALKTQIREVFARAKLFLDLYILDTQAKFYGEPVAFPP